MMDNDNSLHKRPTFKKSITQHQHDQHIYHYDADLAAAFRDVSANPETVRAKKPGTDSSNNDLQSGSSCRFCRWPCSN